MSSGVNEKREMPSIRGLVPLFIGHSLWDCLTSLVVAARYDTAFPSGESAARTPGASTGVISLTMVSEGKNNEEKPLIDRLSRGG